MNKKGFTLIEIIAVVAILGLLAIVGIPNIIKMFSTSVEETMHIQENQVLDAGKLFLEDYCRNPVDNSYKSYCNNHANTLFLFGDLNNDNDVNVLDVVKIRKHVSGAATINEKLIERADINLDSAVNNDDLSILEKFLVGNVIKGESYPEKVYYCISDLKDKGYLKDEIKAKSATCDGFVAFTKLNRSYSNGKTYLYCGEGEYSTVDYNDEDYDKYRAAIDYCDSVEMGMPNNNPGNNNPTQSTFTIAYNANGGSNAPASQTKNIDESIALSSQEPTRDYSIFTGWNTKSDGSGISYAKGSTYSTNSDLVLYAQYNCDACHVSSPSGDSCIISYGTGSNNIQEKGYVNKVSAMYKDESGNTLCHGDLLNVSFREEIADDKTKGNYAMDDWTDDSHHGYCSDDSLGTYGFYRYFTSTHESWQSVCTSASQSYSSCSAKTCNKSPLNSSRVTALGGKLGFTRNAGTNTENINVTATDSSLLFFINFRGEGCYTTNNTVSNILFKMDSGTYSSLETLVDSGVIEPLVLISGTNFPGNFSENVYKGQSLGSSNSSYFNIIVIFTLKKGHTFNSFQETQTIASKNGTSDYSLDHALCGDGTYVRYISTNYLNLVLKNDN